MASHLDHAGGGIDWDSRYVSGDTPWDKGEAHPVLVDWLGKAPVIGRILVPGCGSGHDVRALSQNSHAIVTGLDISANALNLARSFPKTGKETYIEGDFLSGEAVGLESYDFLFEHTCFCAIPPTRREDYVLAASSALRPGGTMLAIFFTNPENDSTDSPPFRCELESTLTLFQTNFDVLETKSGIPTYPGREGRETLCLLRKKARQESELSGPQKDSRFDFSSGADIKSVIPT